MEQHFIEWCGAEYAVSHQELAELAQIAHTYSSVEDIKLAKAIAALTPQQSTEKRWNDLCTAAAIFRVGYILGQRAERSREAVRR